MTNVQPIREETNKKSEAEILDRLVETISEDAKKDPEPYLRETIVPEGGE